MNQLETAAENKKNEKKTSTHHLTIPSNICWEKRRIETVLRLDQSQQQLSIHNTTLDVQKLSLNAILKDSQILWLNIYWSTTSILSCLSFFCWQSSPAYYVCPYFSSPSWRPRTCCCYYKNDCQPLTFFLDGSWKNNPIETKTQITQMFIF